MAVFVSERKSKTVVIARSGQPLRDLHLGITIGKIVGVSVHAFGQIGIEVERAGFATIIRIISEVGMGNRKPSPCRSMKSAIFRSQRSSSTSVLK
jgi:hypothetical protein